MFVLIAGGGRTGAQLATFLVATFIVSLLQAKDPKDSIQNAIDHANR